MSLTARSTASEINNCSVAVRDVSVDRVVPHPANAESSTSVARRTPTDRDREGIVPCGSAEKSALARCQWPCTRRPLHE
jgi:hypothetical protein